MTKPYRSGSKWTESQYAKAGWVAVKLRLRREQLAAVALPNEKPAETLRRVFDAAVAHASGNL